MTDIRKQIESVRQAILMATINKEGGNATSTGTLTSPLKWHVLGGKHYLASKFISIFPPHLTYIETHAGGLSVLLRKSYEGISEVVNDIHDDLINFYRVLRHRDQYQEFIRLCSLTPFSQVEWESSHLQEDDPVHRAWRFFVNCRQSLAGRMDSFAPISQSRTRRGMNEQVSAWLSAVDGLEAIHERLKRVAVLKMDAVELIEQFDAKTNLLFIDPPYLHETRVSKDIYDHEMSREDHEKLLDAITKTSSMVAISSYDNELYRDALKSWTRHEFDVPNNAASGKTKRKMTEILWTNF